jgi:hypothetical protein
MDVTDPGSEDLPEALVEGLNAGLATGDWEAVLEHFTDHGTLVVDRGSRTSFEGPDGIREALEGLREELEGVRYASGPREEDDDTVVTHLLSASGPDAPPCSFRLDLTAESEVREAVLILDDAPPEDPGSLG